MFIKKHSGFTMPEVLITLGIIGIVAVIMLSLMQRASQEKAYEAGRKKALATIGEVGRMLAAQDEMRDSSNAQNFVEGKLKTKLSIVKTCAHNKLQNCGLPSKIKVLKSLNSTETETINMPKSMSELYQYNGPQSGFNSTSYGFLMVNGFAINLFYNPNCSTANVYFKNSGLHNAANTICINAIYDMNGLKAPNEVGKDIGIVTVFYPDYTTIAVAPRLANQYSGQSNFINAQAFCASQDATTPSKEQALSIAFNSKLLGAKANGYFWTNSTYSNTQNWIVRTYGMQVLAYQKTANGFGNAKAQVICVKQ